MIDQVSGDELLEMNPSTESAADPLRLVAVSHTGLHSGAEVVLLRVLQWASEEGWEVTLLCPPGETAAAAAASGLDVVDLPELKLPALPSPLAAALLASREARAGVRTRRAGAPGGVVLLNGVLGLPALWVARRLGLKTPAAWLVHDVVHRRSWRRLIEGCRSAVDLAIGVSEAAAAPVAELGVPTAVVRNGTPWPVDPAATVSGAPIRIGCTALLTSWKGQHVLLDAVAMLDRDDVVVELIGGSFPKDAGYVERLRRRAAETDLAGRVRFLGAVSDPLELERTWTVGVNASTEPEAGPLAVLEYMSIGLPCVATAHGGTTEILGDAGIAVPPGDPTAMAEAIKALLDDPDDRARKGARGRCQVASSLTLEHQRRRAMAVLRRLALTSASRDRRP